MTKRFFILLLLLAGTMSMMADRIGTWQVYSTFSTIKEIAPAGEKVFVMASGSLFSYSNSDHSVETYDRAGILNSTQIAHIRWFPAAKKLMIGYANSDIDLLDPYGNVINMPELYQKTITGSKVINHIYEYGNFAFVSTGFGLLKVNVGEAEVTDTYNIGINVTYSYVKDGYIYAAAKDLGMYRCAMNGNPVNKNEWTRTGDYVASSENRTVVKDDKNNCTWCVLDKKLAAYTTDSQGNKTYIVQGIQPNGPAADTNYRLCFDNGRLYVTTGAWSEHLSGLNLPAKIMVLEDGEWTAFEDADAETIALSRYIDANVVAVDPFDKDHVFSGFKSGLHEYRNGKFIRRYGRDFGLETASTEGTKEHYVIITQAQFDKEGTLWLFNPHTNHPLKSITRSGELRVHDHALFAGPMTYGNDWEGMVMDGDYLWFCNAMAHNPAFFRYNMKTGEADRVTAFINQDGEAKTVWTVFDMEKDIEGNIWVGTDAGIFYVKKEDMATLQITQHKVPRNDGTNLADYLLADITITAIKVDAGNRKWVGTERNGVFLISDDNNTELQHFTAENSPLQSNSIYDIAIDNATGRVFFSTTEGVCSYVSDATEGEPELDADKVWAYPNPVTPDYTGDIIIKGLEMGSRVMITTASGHMVNSGTSNGGMYIWDGRDLQGRPVASGVYMICVATNEGNKGIVSKVAIVR